MATFGKTAAGKNLFRQKPIALIQAECETSQLDRSLGASQLLLLGIGCIIGAGIFVMTGRAAAQFAGPAIMISFLLSGLLCACVALCYAELASALPISGSAYSYAYASLGEGAAWVMGLLLVLEYGVAAAAVAVSWSGYVVSLLHDLRLDLPPALTAPVGAVVRDAAGLPIATGVMNLPAMTIIGLLTLLLFRGIRNSAKVNMLIVAVKLSVILAFIIVGARYVQPAHWVPFVPPQTPPPPPGAPMDLWHQIGRALIAIATGDNSVRYGIGGIVHGAAIIFFAYLGFEAVSTAGAEARNPGRDIPFGILGALVVCTALYVATSAVLVGIVPYTALDNPAPIAEAVNRIGIGWFGKVVKIGAIAGLSSVMLVLLYGQSRIFYSMSRDGLLPRVLAKVHPRFRTPWINTCITGVAVMGAAGFLPLSTLGDLTNVGSLTAFAVVCGTVIYLRIREPTFVRPFRTPFYPFAPVLGILMCLLLLMSLMATPSTRAFFLLYLAAGTAVYFVFGMRSSQLARNTGAAEPNEQVTSQSPIPD